MNMVLEFEGKNYNTDTELRPSQLVSGIGEAQKIIYKTYNPQHVEFALLNGKIKFILKNTDVVLATLNLIKEEEV